MPRDDPMFEKRSLLTERRVGGLEAADFNGDGRTDLAWYGDPRALVVAYQGKDGEFDQRREFKIKDGSMNQNALKTADVDGDGADDLVLLTKKEILVFRQGASGLTEPRRIPAVRENMAFARIADFDGDGRDDLMTVENKSDQPIQFRFQREDGGFGPEIAFDLAATRAVSVVKGKPAGLLVISMASGTLRRLELGRRKIGGEPALGRPRVYAYGGKSSAKRMVVTGDFDRDGKTDLVATDPSGARVLFYRQESGDLDGPHAFPTFRSVVDVCAADADGDGHRD